jgi:NAD(P)H dehydrogenase (quinone)
MRVLTVYAHSNPKSFCHAVLEQFDEGLREAGHNNDVVDLYEIGFDPVLRPRDTPSWLTETIPDDMLAGMRLRETLLEEAGGPLRRFALKRLIGDRDARGIIRLLRERYQSKDVLAQQQKVAWAEALAFVAPVHFLSFPAILKGWLDRVWTPGFAYDLTAEAWRGDINGRQPRLTHEKALIIQTTIFDRHAYDAGLRDAMRTVIDEFTLTFPGIKRVEHEYFYAVHGADDATRRGYLARARHLGREFQAA